MDVTILPEVFPIQFLQELWLLGAGRAPLALWLLLIAGFACAQLHHRPQAMRWFLMALGLTIVWEGGAGSVLMPNIAGLWDDGSSDLGLMDTAFLWLAWYICPCVVHGLAAACLLMAAFGEPISTTAAEGTI